MPAAAAVRNAVLPASRSAIVSAPLIRTPAEPWSGGHGGFDDSKERIGKRLVPSRLQVQSILIYVVVLVAYESRIGVDKCHSFRTDHCRYPGVGANNCIIRNATIGRAPEKGARRCQRTYEDVAHSIFRAFASPNQVSGADGHLADCLRAFHRVRQSDMTGGKQIVVPHEQ